jgi:hypothetical protein
MGWLIFLFALLAGALIVNYPVGVIAIVVVTTARASASSVGTTNQ